MAQAELSPEQNAIFLAALSGESFFLSGSAGVGKSFLLVRIIEALKAKFPKYTDVAVTASTGVAALNIRGSTVHSWAGIGLALDPPAAILRRLSRKARMRWHQVEVLILDEISMLSPAIFDLLEFLARSVRKVDAPFGDIQVIICGDFLQLPPVEKDQPSEYPFAFHARSWPSVIRRQYILNRVFRQKNPEFVRMLQEIRLGTPSSQTIDALRSRIMPPRPIFEGVKKALHQGDLEPISLYPTNVSVDRLNNQRLSALPFPTVRFSAVESGEEMYRKQLDSACLAPLLLEVKVGAQVMLLKNLSFEDHLVNGSRGIVMGYTRDLKSPYWRVTPENFIHPPFPSDIQVVPIVQFPSITCALSSGRWEITAPGRPDEVLAKRDQVPLRLAWAVTIHKCVRENTLISTATGLLRIGSLSQREGWAPVEAAIDTLAGRERIARVFKGEVEASRQITTALGYFLEASLRHPVLVRERATGAGVWKLAPEIVPGDCVVLRSRVGGAVRRFRLPESGGGEVDEGLAYAVGVIFGGITRWRFSKDGIRLTIGDADRCRAIQQSLEQHFSNQPELLNRHPDLDDTIQHDVFCSKEILVTLGLGPSINASSVNVPESILQSPQDVQKHFIKGLFDEQCRIDSSGHIFISSSSLAFARTLHVLLLSLGIVSRRSILHPSTLEDKPLQQIEIFDPQNIQFLFNNNVIESTLDLSSSHVNLFTDTVVSIEGSTCQMYDVEVPGSHSFISNGIVSHNCQGLTLESIEVDLSNCFANGQMYTALSRVSSFEGLRIIGKWDDRRIMAHPQAIEFYEQMDETAESSKSKKSKLY